MKRMHKLELAVAIGLVFTIFFCSVSGFAAQCEDIRGKVLRLHILANSDTQEDQTLKLKVRDRILEETGTLFYDTTKAGAEEKAKEHLDWVKQIAQDEIQRQGYAYPVKAELVNMYFTTRQYEDITMPAGRYDAVRITIGEAKGQNWWCVLYPALCIPAAEPKQELGDALTQEEVELVESNPKYEVRFAIVEWWEGLKEAIFG